MAYSRLPSLVVASVTCLVAGCAGPTWFARVDLLQTNPARTAQESSPQDAKTTKANATDLAPPADERSLSQLLDDLERIKQRNPSDYAVIQSAIEDTSNLFPAEYQQVYRDQVRGIAELQHNQTPLEPADSKVPMHATHPQTQTAVQPVAHAAAHPSPAPSRQSPIELALATEPPMASSGQSIAPIVQPSRQAPIAVANVSQTPAANTVQVTPNDQAVQIDGATAKVEEPANAQSIDVVDWSHRVEQALTGLNAKLAKDNLDRDERARLEILRRLLFVATNQRDEAVSPIEQLDEDEREYWKHQMHGLLVSLDTDGKHPTTRRAAIALRELRDATNYLANLSTLDVNNLRFCNEVLSYGEYRAFDSYSFRAKDEVVLYVEIDNFAAHARGDDFETELHGSYEIVDSAGRRVANVVLPVDKQLSANRRRDYFIAYLITLPSQIAPGSYRLQLTIEDVIGKKSNYAAIDFRIQ